MKKQLLRMLSLVLPLLAASGLQTLLAEPTGLAGSLRIAQERYLAAHTPGLRSGGLPEFKLVYIGTEKAIVAPSSLRSTAVEEALLYVYNVGTDGGFVVVSGEDHGKQLLGISGRGSLPANGLSDNMTGLLMMYTRYVKALRNGALSAEAGTADIDTAAFPEKVIPLLRSEWEGGFPYNVACPVIDDYLSEAGPAAVAMAQIMYFYKYPQGGIGHVNYKFAGSTHAFGAHLTGSTYYWNDMPTRLDDSSSDQEVDAVAQLIFHCGVTAQTNYEYGSTAENEDVRDAFVNHFSYDKNLQLYDRAFFSEEEWIAMLKTELAAMRPVYYSGEGGENDQSYRWVFVCDGYNTENMFHLKTGYAGDGYFELGAICLDFYTQNEHQQMITGIRKPTDSSHPATLLGISSLQVDSDKPVRLGEKLPVSFTLKNFGQEGNYTVAPALFKEDEAIEARKEDLEPAFELADFKRGAIHEQSSLTFADIPDSTATYYLYVMACKTDESVMKPVRTAAHPYDYVVVQVKDGLVTLSKARKKLEADPIRVSYDADNKAATFAVTFHNNQKEDYYGTVGLIVKSPEVPVDEYSWEMNNWQSIPSGESREVSFTGGFDWYVGDTMVVTATYQSGLRDLWYPAYTDIVESTCLFILKLDGSIAVSNEEVRPPEAGFAYTFNSLTGELTLQADAVLKSLSLYRYDGRLVRMYPIGRQGTFTKQLSLSPGHYLLKVLTDKGAAVRKIHKQ